jgi:hypothetical protein
MRYADPREPGIIGPVYRGQEAIATKGTLPVPNGSATQGAWSSVFSWPLIGLHAVMTPGGKLLTYGTTATGIQGGSQIYDVWDPALGVGASSHTTLPNQTTVDTFCSSQILLPRGEIQIFGGDVMVNGATTNTGNNRLLLFKPSDNSLTNLGTMHRTRWYRAVREALTFPKYAAPITVKGC